MFRSTAVVAALVLAAGLTGCRQDMHDQPKFIPQRGSTFFDDGRSARPQVVGTVARGQNDIDSYFETGLIDGKEGSALPYPVSLQMLQRGQERFNIYCSPCHSRVGNGEGRIVQRGYYQAANFQSDRLQSAPDGHFFNVITHGFGVMPEYRAEIAPADRWAIVAYIRALQLSQNARTADATPGTRLPSLSQVTEEQGLPASFASDTWTVESAPKAVTSLAAAAPAATPPANTAVAQAATPALHQQEQTAGSAKGGPAATAAAKPPAAPAGDATAGKAIYEANCQVCHQPTRLGLPPMIPALVGIVPKVGEAKIRQTVTNGVPTGKPPMPSFAGKLSDSDIDNLIAFLKTTP